MANRRRWRERRCAASCATCHARDFCTECHVNAPEVPPSRRFNPDPRSLAHQAELRAAGSHADPAFLFRHGHPARQGRCRLRHLPHAGELSRLPSGVAHGGMAMHAAGPGRGPGARVERKRPATHGIDFSDNHAEPASPGRRAAARVTLAPSAWIATAPMRRIRVPATIPPAS